MDLRPEHEVVDSSVIKLDSGEWFAGIRIRIPRTDGVQVERDVFRVFDGTTAEFDARKWVMTKLSNHDAARRAQGL